jgi:hypothetical protein
MIEIMSVLRMTRVFFPSVLLVGSVALPASAQEACFVRLDNGTDKTGWHVSSTNHHGPGNGWTVEDGAFVGRQTAGQQGGILMTDKVYKDVEVVFQVQIDWGCDSGFFFRTTAGDRAYQVNVDHLAEAGVGTIWGESFAQELRVIPYFLTDMGNAAVKATPDAMPIFDLAKWSTIWKPTEFNEIRARVEGNPPHMQVWISDLKVMDFSDQMLRSEIDPEGPLAIQVHMGTRWIPDGTVRFKNIRVKDLTVPCDEPDPGTGGAGGSAGAGGAGSGGAAGMAGAVEAGSAGQAAGGVQGSAGNAGAATAGATGGTVPLTPIDGSSAGTSGATSIDDAGCGCAVPGGTARHDAALFSLLLAASLARRRLTRGARYLAQQHHPVQKP